MERKEHWEQVYATKAIDGVSWYQPRADLSLDLIAKTGVPHTASIIDVGGGASMLVDDLQLLGYRALTVLDIAAGALAAAQQRLGAQAGAVQWLEADITAVTLLPQAYDIWHDRAVFHFLTAPGDRRAYVDAVLRSLRPGGYLILATFAEDGPLQCSGLPVVRYSPAALHALFGEQFTLIRHVREAHQTPSGSVQQFVYCCLARQQDSQNTKIPAA